MHTFHPLRASEKKNISSKMNTTENGKHLNVSVYPRIKTLNPVAFITMYLLLGSFVRDVTWPVPRAPCPVGVRERWLSTDPLSAVRLVAIPPLAPSYFASCQVQNVQCRRQSKPQSPLSRSQPLGWLLSNNGTCIVPGEITVQRRSRKSQRKSTTRQQHEQ